MESARTALLLNPPGKEVYIRDYYCSKTSRTNYTFPPIDLLHAGGIFRQRDWQLAAIDAIAENLSPERVLERARQIGPRAVFSLVGAVSAGEDALFLPTLRQTLPDAVLIGSGDVLIEHGRQWVERGLLDAACLDFASSSPVRYADGEREGLDDLIYRDGEEVLAGGRNPSRNVSAGRPPHELFLAIPYRFPFARKRPFASLLTDYGCPFRCTFCVMSGLHYHRRPLGEVAAELDGLRKAGIREFILWDQTFAVDRERGMEFLGLLPEGKEQFGWTCLVRPDRIDRELALRMAAKGCHTVIMGVETAKAETLVDIKKDFTTKEVREAFALCREAGLEIVATVIVGLPGESERDVMATMDFIRETDPDYLSVHTAIPRQGTGLRAGMIKDGLISQSLANMDQSGEVTAVSSDTLDAEAIVLLRRGFNRRFHMRPGYLLRTVVRRLRHPRLFLEQFRQGLVLLGRNVGWRH